MSSSSTSGQTYDRDEAYTRQHHQDSHHRGHGVWVPGLPSAGAPPQTAVVGPGATQWRASNLTPRGRASAATATASSQPRSSTAPAAMQPRAPLHMRFRPATATQPASIYRARIVTLRVASEILAALESRSVKEVTAASALLTLSNMSAANAPASPLAPLRSASAPSLSVLPPAAQVNLIPQRYFGPFAGGPTQIPRVGGDDDSVIREAQASMAAEMAAFLKKEEALEEQADTIGGEYQEEAT
ncbi:hypothetical protein DOTSEDRAFT_31487 [Dothistroma septosporum NZE10]|uniref:Uncharacterized protein n=1 Tax=Dothistroma septosporum (strain NZE10 / CBS 128990) TaxID=675120 RepID=N1PX24_DOTSN|nr:hypothetical protein DOTSEDRAFT_31487 [Dothistroma septosporum NZE10]